MASGKRRAERTGRIFTLTAAERICETAIAFLSGMWVAGFIIDVSGMAKSRPLWTGVLGAAVSIIVVCCVHFLLEAIMKKTDIKFSRRKWQLVAVCVAAAGMSAAFPVGAPAYDGYLPEQVAAVGISVDGINMDYDTYLEVSRKNECYEADSQMEKYTLSSEGKTAVMG